LAHLLRGAHPRMSASKQGGRGFPVGSPRSKVRPACLRRVRYLSGLPTSNELPSCSTSCNHAPPAALSLQRVREETKIEIDAEDGVEFTVLPQGALAPVVDGPVELARMNAAVATSVAGHAAAEDAYSAFDAVTSVRRFAAYKPELLAPHL
jgi:hypothetical protein